MTTEHLSGAMGRDRSGQRKPRRARTIACALTLASIIIASGCGGADEPIEEAEIKAVKLLTLSSSDPTLGKKFPGQAKATQTANLSFRVSGPLVEFPATEGQNVTTGELLARIDARDFQTALAGVEGSLEEARAQLAAMSAGARAEDIKVMESRVSARQAELEKVRQNLERYTELLEEKAISQAEFDSVKAAYDVAASNLESAEQELQAGRKGAREEDIAAQESRIRGLEAQQADAANALADTELRAPFDGVVAQTYVDNFEEIQAKQEILILQDTSRIEIEIHISENDMAAARGDGTIEEAAKTINAVATFGAFPEREFDVRLKSYETQADAQTQTFAVTLVMDQPEDVQIRPGMNATIVGRGRAGDEIGAYFFVPVSAVIADAEGNQTVWVVDPTTNKIQRRRVEVDEMAGDRIRIIDGLKTGEVIAVSAVQMLREGMQVTQMRDLKEL